MHISAPWSLHVRTERPVHMSPSERGKEKAVTTCKLKNLHSCLVLTSLGTAACGAVALSWPARNTWPAPPAIGRATAKWDTRHRKTFTTNRKTAGMLLLNLNLQFSAFSSAAVNASCGPWLLKLSFWLLLSNPAVQLCPEHQDWAALVITLSVLACACWSVKTYPPPQDLVDGSTFLQCALSHHLSPHFLHVEHEGIQRFLYVDLFLFLLFLFSVWLFPAEGGGKKIKIKRWGSGTSASTCEFSAVAVYSRAVERADVTVGGFLLDVGCDDGWVWDARGVQTVVRGHHVWGEPRGQKTV